MVISSLALARSVKPAQLVQFPRSGRRGFKRAEQCRTEGGCPLSLRCIRSGSGLAASFAVWTNLGACDIRRARHEKASSQPERSSLFYYPFRSSNALLALTGKRASEKCSQASLRRKRGAASSSCRRDNHQAIANVALVSAAGARSRRQSPAPQARHRFFFSLFHFAKRMQTSIMSYFSRRRPPA